jgi:hypothetical protein
VTIPMCGWFLSCQHVSSSAISRRPFWPSSGFYESSKIASFQLLKHFIAVFGSWGIVDLLYYSHFIRIHVPKCEFWLWSKAFFTANNCPSLNFCKILKVSPNSKFIPFLNFLEMFFWCVLKRSQIVILERINTKLHFPTKIKI